MWGALQGGGKALGRGGRGSRPPSPSPDPRSWLSQGSPESPSGQILTFGNPRKPFSHELEGSGAVTVNSDLAETQTSPTQPHTHTHWTPRHGGTETPHKPPGKRGRRAAPPSVGGHREAAGGGRLQPPRRAHRPGPPRSPHVLQHVEDFGGQVRVLHVELREVGLQQRGWRLLWLQGGVLLLDT